MELENINKLYLELSQIATAKTAQEIYLNNMYSWREISSAPNDGQKIILARITEQKKEDIDFGDSYEPPRICWAALGFWCKRYKNWNDGLEPSGLASPTHWMLPPPTPIN